MKLRGFQNESGKQQRCCTDEGSGVFAGLRKSKAFGRGPEHSLGQWQMRTGESSVKE